MSEPATLQDEPSPGRVGQRHSQVELGGESMGVRVSNVVFAEPSASWATAQNQSSLASLSAEESQMEEASHLEEETHLDAEKNWQRHTGVTAHGETMQMFMMPHALEPQAKRQGAFAQLEAACESCGTNIGDIYSLTTFYTHGWDYNAMASATYGEGAPGVGLPYDDPRLTQSIRMEIADADKVVWLETNEAGPWSQWYGNITYRWIDYHASK